MDRSKQAWLAFISTDNYIYYVLNLYKCLQDSKTSYPFYCGVTKTVSQSSIDILKMVGINVLVLDTQDIEQSELIHRDAQFGMSTRYINALTKLDLLKTGEELFDKIVYLDSDLHIFENVDELFDYPHMAAVEDIAPAVKHLTYTLGQSVFCSGLFVWDYQTNHGLIKQIIANLDNLPKEVKHWHDQNILNYYYQDWKDRPELHLDATYGLMINNRAMRLFVGSPKIRHFVQPNKEKIPFKQKMYLNQSGDSHIVVYEYYKSVAKTIEHYKDTVGIMLESVYLENINRPSSTFITSWY